MLQASPSKVAPRGRSTIIATGFKKTGAPIWEGTPIWLTADRGRIEPPQVVFNEGRAEATYFAPDSICVASINATSGSVEISGITVEVGFTISSLVLTASRRSLPAGGGSVVVRAIAYDEENNPVRGAPIVFTATAGTLASGGRPIAANASGVAKDTLTTTTDTTVVAYSASVASDAVDITVEDPVDNLSPVADFVYSPRNPLVRDTVHFNGGLSTDPDGRVVTWQWDLGDGATAWGKRTSHAYADAGTYAVLLCVTDDDGARDCQTYDVQVAEPSVSTAGRRR
ncbi:MAG: PKD domain-containing protein [Acidobacteriota bacterium]